MNEKILLNKMKSREYCGLTRKVYNSNMAENVPVNPVHFFRGWAQIGSYGVVGPLPESYFANKRLILLRQVPGHILRRLVKPPE